jgi:hypothetical protein
MRQPGRVEGSGACRNEDIVLISAALLSACASPPRSNHALVESACAQQCFGFLITCTSHFTFTPVIQQQMCNDNYDVCIKG